MKTLFLARWSCCLILLAIAGSLTIAELSAGDKGGVTFSRSHRPHGAPQCGCPDDYCSKPWRPKCTVCSPPYYQCVPAGDCGCQREGSPNKLTWWFLPKPRALLETFRIHR